MASKAEYLNMMKRMDNESVMRPDEIEEMLPILDDPNLKGLSLIHISEPTRRRGISYAVFCLKKKKRKEKEEVRRGGGGGGGVFFFF